MSQRKTFSKESEIIRLGEQKDFFSPKELGILNVAAKIPAKIPTEKQCVVLIGIFQKAEEEGFLNQGAG